MIRQVHPGLIRLAFRLGAGLALAGAMVTALGSALQLTSAALGSYAAIQAGMRSRCRRILGPRRRRRGWRARLCDRICDGGHQAFTPS